jgi:hypothetical protein
MFLVDPKVFSFVVKGVKVIFCKRCLGDLIINQRLSRACIVHLVIKRTNWSYVKTMSCSGSHLGITILLLFSFLSLAQISGTTGQNFMKLGGVIDICF